MTGQTPPGWYPDPQGTPGLQRWWDGGRWTDGTQSAPSAPPSAPTPWQPPAGSQPSTPQPWAPVQIVGPQHVGNPPPPPRSGGGQGMLLALLGGGALVVVLALVALFVVINKDDDKSDPPIAIESTAEPLPPSPSAETPSPGPSTSGDGTASPVVGTINDPVTGLSYARLGGRWALDTVPAAARTKLGFTTGELAIVQSNYNGKNGNWSASINTLELPSTVFYTNGNLEAAAKAYFGSIVRPELYPGVLNTVETVSSKSYTVSGKKAWYYEIKLNYPEAASKNYNFRTEAGVLILVDRPGKRPAGIFLSVPDSHHNQGDTKAVVDSLKSQ